MTKKEAIVIEMYTGICMLTGDDWKYFYEYAEKLLGRPIMTHEYPEYAEKLKELSKPDFLQICKLAANDGWIPVEKQLPEPGRIVIVNQCYSWENFEDYACVTIGRISPDTLHWEFRYYRPNFERGTIMDNDIICPGNEYVLAWRPLPEPYLPE